MSSRASQLERGARATFSLFAALSLLSLGGCAKPLAEGRQALDAVDVVGGGAVDEDDVEDKLATSPSPKFLGLFRGVVYDYEVFDRFVLQRDMERVERFYRARGYYEAHARVARVFQVSPKHVRVEIVVQEGSPILVRRVRVNGVEALSEAQQKVVKRVAQRGLRPNTPFDEQAFDDAANAALRKLTDAGYAHATLQKHAAVDLVTHTADVDLDVHTGPLATLGKVTLVGLGDLPEGPVRRALDLEEGAPYSTATLDAAGQAALDLGVFASVDVKPDLSDANATVVPVTVKLEEARLHAVKLGGGVEFDATKSDVHALAGWEAHNFLGGMRTFSVEFRPGIVFYPLRIDNVVKPTQLLPEEKLRLELRQPGLFEARTQGFVRPELNVFPFLPPKLPETSAVLGYREVKGAVGVDRVFGGIVYASLLHNLNVENPFTYKGDLDPALRTLVVSAPELIVNLDLRNDRIHPRKGIYVGTDFQVAGGPFGGHASDVKLQPEARGYVPLGRRFTLATRVATGFLFPRNYGDIIENHLTDDLTDQNRADRTREFQIMYFRGLFSGGPSSNRGYPLRGIGPHTLIPFLNPDLAALQASRQCDNPQTDEEKRRCSMTVGGLTLWEAALELRFKVSGPFELAGFCDASDVSPRQVDFRFNRPHLSCGAGARYDTPVGPVRLDIGYRIPGLQGTDTLVSSGAAPAGSKAYDDQIEGEPPTILGLPIGVAFGIGEAF